MNYKYLVMDEFKGFCDRFPDYSISEILFTILKSANKSKDVSWIYEMTDRELLTAIENANIKEKEDNEN